MAKETKNDGAQFNAGPYVSYIWSIADDWLRDVYVPSDYRKVILPMVVLRRLDLLLEPTKAAVLEMKARLDEEKVTDQDGDFFIDEFNTLWGGIRWTNADNVLNWIKRTPETIAKDEKFSNAVRFAGEENARLECEAVMKRLVVESLKDSTEFYKQFKDNDAFRAWIMNRMFERAREIVAA